GGCFESRHFHRDVVRAGLQQRRFEIPLSVGHQLCGGLGVHVRDLDGGTGDHSVGILSSSKYLAAGFLSARREAHKERESNAQKYFSHMIFLPSSDYPSII